MGIGKARTLILPGWHHVVGETYYGGKWHYLDLDVRAAFRRSDGSLASIADAQRDASLWKGQGPLFFPLDPLEQTRKIYQKTAVHYYNGYHFSGHTMDYVLRQGETFTRWYAPQGGRWHHIPTYHEAAFHKKLLERAPRGPKCKHEGWTVHTHGNGRFVYQPKLTDKYTDFGDGAYDADNIIPAAGGLTLKKAGQGHALFEVRSPYIIVPLVGKMETTADDREASVVQLNAVGARLAISLDNGITWKDVGAAGKTLDLTPYVSGTYGYLLKITLRGEPGKAVVRSLKITTWVQVAPAALPSLRRGKNRMEYRTGDHYGLASRVLEIRTNGSDRADFFKHLSQAPRDFDPRRHSGRARGQFVVKIQPPPHSRIAWFSAGANFVTHQQGQARKTRNEIAYAVDRPTDFKRFYKAEVPTNQGHWHYNADREVKLKTPARLVYLRYVGDPGVNNLRIYAHCVDDRPRTGSRITIRHGWEESGVLKTTTVKLKGPGHYEITTAAEPTDKYIEMSIPSSPRKLPRE
jgi:hypothetical protein